MPLDKITPDEEISGKFTRLVNYTKGLYGQTFGIDYPGGRNRMVKVIIYNVNFISFVNELKQIPQPYNEVDSARIIRHLNLLIDLSNTPDEYWEPIWKGEHELFHLENYTVYLKDGKKEVIKTIADLQKITILE
jgi:hypothetical protein